MGILAVACQVRQFGAPGTIRACRCLTGRAGWAGGAGWGGGFLGSCRRLPFRHVAAAPPAVDRARPGVSPALSDVAQTSPQARGGPGGLALRLAEARSGCTDPRRNSLDSRLDLFYLRVCRTPTLSLFDNRRSLVERS